jgi:hypothetical protein
LQLAQHAGDSAEQRVVGGAGAQPLEQPPGQVEAAGPDREQDRLLEQRALGRPALDPLPGGQVDGGLDLPALGPQPGQAQVGGAVPGRGGDRGAVGDGREVAVAPRQLQRLRHPMAAAQAGVAALGEGEQALVRARAEQAREGEGLGRGGVAVEQLARAAEVELAVEVVRVEPCQPLEHDERRRVVALVEQAAPDREQGRSPA